MSVVQEIESRFWLHIIIVSEISHGVSETMFVIGEDQFKAHGVCHVYVESGTTRIACFLWYPVAFWGYFAVFTGVYMRSLG